MHYEVGGCAVILPNILLKNFKKMHHVRKASAMTANIALYNCNYLTEHLFIPVFPQGSTDRSFQS